MTDDDVIPMRPDRVIATVGGSVDEVRVTLALYGDDLDPVEISNLLGCGPTSSHRRGETRIGNKTDHVTVYKQGAWFLSVEGRAPRTADALTTELLEKVSSDDSVWSALGHRFDVQMRYGIFLEAWNRGFGLSRDVVRRVAGLGASLEFDVYADLESETAQP
jgi:Domain of unknown function (DUF4279)